MPAFTNRTGVLTLSRHTIAGNLDDAARAYRRNDDGQDDKDDHEPLVNVPTETGDSARAEKNRDVCEYHKENHEFEKATPELRWPYLY